MYLWAASAVAAFRFSSREEAVLNVRGMRGQHVYRAKKLGSTIARWFI
jgi:hypothetical protein